ncbi:unnamed protein product [Darwinula stevensoni]|uniref:G-protein coupled receptors family 1 profile domain-containing protein n=1 Tax=Darwinula stevensoni TaxID=69355 RepID=A0A7R9AGC4_9CRUS|nr:unnamed protein product [Darwinula stevensoni]CAG0903529.1 unnamed protein product [Darwinula stevensoni]
MGNALECDGENSRCSFLFAENLRHDPTVTAIICVSFAAVFLVGLVGNFLVLAAIARDLRLRTVTNLFIANVALADILVLLLCFPNYFLGGIFYANFVVKTHHLDARREQYSLGLSMQISEVGEFCITAWPVLGMERMYIFVGTVVFCNLIPSILTFLCYLAIWMEGSWRRIPTGTRDPTVSRVQQRPEEGPVLKVFVVVSIVFFLFWAPFHFFLSFPGSLFFIYMNVINYMLFIALMLGLSNSCIKPILYACLNKKLRDGFLAVLQSCRYCRTQRTDDNSPALALNPWEQRGACPSNDIIGEAMPPSPRNTA